MMTLKNPVHPGRIVKSSIEELELTVTAAAKMLNVSRSRLSNLINGKAGISPEMAVRLSKTIGSTPAFWLRLQMNYDLAEVKTHIPHPKCHNVSKEEGARVKILI
ncbi:HTH-type transcriptional regulator [Microcystis viridis NIES-102]|uniref:HTH-type transcriptional regulator n=1 Tax=Microcystis viridis NIES-102 TaxID=213615 RepID=A0A3G9JCQ7_MICVR|nr:HigA family addiction module antitoxin [Microcystis viridis]BBH38473.1 HTH-type transcriptional regulator [Microcystis viridis NIES-102]